MSRTADAKKRGYEHPTSEERIQRLERCEELLQSGLTVRNTRRHLQHEFHIARSTAVLDIRWVQRRWAEEAKEQWGDEGKFERRNEMRKRFEGLYEAAFADKDYRACERILWRLVELDGLQEPTRVEHDVKHSIERLTDEQLLYEATKAKQVLAKNAQSSEVIDVPANAKEPVPNG